LSPEYPIITTFIVSFYSGVAALAIEPTTKEKNKREMTKYDFKKLLIDFFIIPPNLKFNKFKKLNYN